VRFVYDYGQLYVYDATLSMSDDGNAYLDVLDAATEAGLTVGAAAGIVGVLMPRQENFSAEIEVVTVESASPVSERAVHVVEFDVISSGRITLEGSGGSGKVEIGVPPGRYRVRLSGFEFDAAEQWSYSDPGYPADHYRLELWPSDRSEPPTELKRWPGWAERLSQ